MSNGAESTQQQLRTRATADALLAENSYDLGPELGPMAKIFDQPQLFEPFVASYERVARECRLCLTGRKTIPIRIFAGIMFKHMSDLSYRDFCEQVKDRISWRVFCRIPLGKKVPDYSTSASWCKGSAASVRRDELGLAQSSEREKQAQGKKIKIDITVVESNIEHPTDVKIQEQGISKI